VSRVLRPTRHITGHFRDESLQAITYTGSLLTTQNKQDKIHQKDTNWINWNFLHSSAALPFKTKIQ